MFPPYVVEEYDNKFWVHEQGRFDMRTGKRIMGELAFEDPFVTREEAQEKACEMEIATGALW